MLTARELDFNVGEATVYDDGKRYVDYARVIVSACQRALNSLDILESMCGELEAFSKKYEGQEWTKENFERECPWNTQDIFTGDGMFGKPGSLVIHYDAPSIRNLTPNTPISGVGISFFREQDSKVRVYSAEELKELERNGLLNKMLKEDQVVDGNYFHPVWGGLARGDNSLLKDFVPLKFKALKYCYGYNEGMTIFVPNDGKLRVIVLYGTSNRAHAYCSGNFNNYNTCLIGVRDLSTPKNPDKSLESCVSSANPHSSL